MYKTNILIFMMLFLFSCSDESSALVQQTAIRAGRVVQPGEILAKQVADLSIQKGSQWFSCSGTLIAPDLILTAAHCLQGQQNPLVLATIGRNSKRSQSCFVHPKFNNEALNDRFNIRPTYDLAIIKLALPFPESFTPMQLPLMEFRNGQSISIAGFGEDEHKKMGILKTANIPNASYIASSYDIMHPIGSAGIEFGDSGGAAFRCSSQECVIFGVTSRTLGLRREDVYSSVFASISWIKSHLKK